MAVKPKESGMGWAPHANPWVNLAVGALLILASLILLRINENRAVTAAVAMADGVFSAAPAKADMILPGHEGKLVYVSGEVTGAGAISDPQFGLEPEALCVIRRVETNQWIEERDPASKGVGRNASYIYKTQWSEDYIDSSGYIRDGHVNPMKKPAPSKVTTAPGAKLGAFRIRGALCSAFDSPQKLPFTEEDFNKLSGEWRMNYRLVDNSLYLSMDPLNPAIGDVRISFYSVSPKTASVVARQVGSDLVPATRADGSAVAVFKEGAIPLDQMYPGHPGHNPVLAMALRLAGLFVLFLGMLIALNPLEEAASFFPKLWGALSAKWFGMSGKGALGMGLLAMSAPWYGFQPMACYGLLAVGAGMFGLLALDIQKAQPKFPPPPPPKPLSMAPSTPGLYNGEPEVYRPKKPAFFAVAADAAIPPAEGLIDPEPGVYRPKRPPTLTAPPKTAKATGPAGQEAPPSASGINIERAFVFHEGEKLDKEKMAQLIIRRETSTGQPAPRLGGVSGIHLAQWPKDKSELFGIIQKGIAAFHKKHPESPDYTDKTMFQVKVWQGGVKAPERFIVAELILKTENF